MPNRVGILGAKLFRSGKTLAFCLTTFLGQGNVCALVVSVYSLGLTVTYGCRQSQEVTAQSSFYSANDQRLHFGLGAETTVELTVRWTNGKTETIPNVAANQLVVIREVAGIIRNEKFR